MSEGWIPLALVPVLIGMNAFFVAGEYALVAARPVHLEAMRAKGRRGAATAMAALRQNPASAIAAIQVCITMTNLLLGFIGEPAMRRVLETLVGPLKDVIPPAAFSAGSIAIGFIVVTYLTVVFSELLPKALTLRYVPSVATFTAQPVLLIMRFVRPLVWLMNATASAVTRPLGLGGVEEGEREHHTVEEIRMITAEAARAGELTLRERSLILNSLALGRRTARQIMVPRVRVAYLDLQKSMDENRRVVNEHIYSRLPLCDGGIDNVIGIVPTREFLAAYNAAGESSVLSLIARPSSFAPDSIPLDRLLILFDEKKTQMVILVDEDGDVQGLVTLRDVVDELVGKPLDADASRRAVPFVVRGDQPLHELAARLGADDLGSEQSVVTVGGLVVEKLGRFPTKGDTVTLDGGVVLRVLDSDRHRVRRVEVIPPAVVEQGV